MWLCKLPTTCPAECSHWGAPGPDYGDMECNGRAMFELCCPFREYVEEKQPVESSNSDYN